MSDVWKNYWPIFERLESELCEVTFAVAFADVHLKVYSSRLADLLLRSCAECENVGKSLCLDKNLSQSRGNISRFNFPAIGTAIRGSLNAIHTKELAIIWPYQSLTTTTITPFNTWGPVQVHNPVWFHAHDSVKHDRINNAQEATVENVIGALGGLFILNLWLREDDITQYSEHINLAEKRITAYSKFFSPRSFLQLESRAGVSGPMSGSNLRSLVFDWK